MSSKADIERIDLQAGLILFEDGEKGKITNWVDTDGNVFDTSIPQPKAVVGKHPTSTYKPWVSCAVYEDEWLTPRKED